MYLLEKTEKSYNVYEFSPIKEKVREYKEKEMQKIPQEYRVLTVITNNRYEMEYIYDYSYLKFIYSNKTNEFSYHDIAPSTDKESNEEILNDYYNDVDNQEFSYTIKGTNNNDIFLVTTGEYYEESFNIPCYKVFKHILEDGIDKYKSNININEYYKYYKKHKNKTVTLKEMDGIINIPESLYDYHRFIDFLNGTISSMNKKEIESLLPLFKMSKEIVKKFDIEEVQKLDKDIKKYMGLNNHICEKLEEKCHHSEKILSLVKKN